MNDEIFHRISKKEYQQFFSKPQKNDECCGALQKKKCLGRGLLSRFCRDFLKKETRFAPFRHGDIENQSEGVGLSALKVAMDIRKFEIDLYWKRTTFFWAFLVSIYSAYFFVCHNSRESLYLILLSFLASCFSLLWYISNRGSKFWQENWEAHVSALENEQIGPLFKTIKKNKANFYHILSPYDFSVSKANIIASVLILLMSSGLFFLHSIFFFDKLTSKELRDLLQNHLAVIAFVVVFVVVLVAIGLLARGFASKAKINNEADSEFVMRIDTYNTYMGNKS